MKAFTWRVGLCPLLLLLIARCSAVDPVDFLESLKDDEDLPPVEGSSTEYPNGVNVIPGEADVNYPVYSSIPKSSFSCIGRPVGFYADTELRCQVWHICDEESRQQSFLCTNGTVYSQEKRVCDWWYNVNCDPNEVSRNYEQNYELYKGPPPKSESDNEQGQENKINDNYNGKKKSTSDFDEFKSSTTKAASRDPFYNQPASTRQNFEQQQQRYNNNKNDQQYSKPTPSYDEPSTRGRDSSFSSNNNDDYVPSASRRQPLPSARPATTSTTYRPPTTYSTPPPPAALQGNPFSSPSRSSSNNRQASQSAPQQTPTKSSFPHPPPPPPGSPGRSQPSIKTSNVNGKRTVEIRVPISQIPPEILAKYGKRIPEHILKEIFLNFTRGQQHQLQQEAIKTANPTGAGNSRSSPPSAPIPQSQPQSSQSAPRSQSKKPVHFNSPPPPPPLPSSSNNKGPNVKSNNNNNHPPPPPPPAEPQQKFRHSTPRKVDGVKFATPTRELLADYDDERQQVGESQNPIYSYQQLFNGHYRTSGKSQRVKESFTDPPVTTTTTTSTTQAPFPQHPQQPYQDFSRAQPRRRTQVQTTSTPRYTPTTEEPQLITDRYFPVATKEEKAKAEVRRIFLIAKQGIQVLPPIPVLSGSAAREEFPPQPTPRRFPDVTRRPQGHRQTTTEAFKKLPPPPPPPKVSIPEDYYVKNERFQEAESRYPTPSIPPTYVEQYSQPRQRTTSTTTTSTTSTTTTTQSPPSTQYYQEPDFFRRSKPNKPQQSNKKKATTTPPPEEKKDSYNDYEDDGSPKERVNTDELELLRLAQEYIELTGQDFGIKQRRKE